MKKLPRPGTGFWLSFGLNLVFRGEWLLAAFGALVLHYLFWTPLFLVWIALGIWVVASLAVTLLLTWAEKAGGDGPAYQGQRISERLKRRTREEPPAR